MIFSREPVVKKYIRIQDYLDGYGIGELEPHDFNVIIDAFRQKFGEISVR
ncbi:MULTISPECIES: hypothetical protein [Archaeoglobus]|nr:MULTISPECIES: hypothetical protein [Archaeoglobus]MDI3497822.1 hypothetical protein [Archaeoglobus sp.]